MIKAEKYFKDYCKENDKEHLLEYKYDFIILIKKAQRDVIRETCQYCADNSNNPDTMLDCAEILIQNV